MAMAACRCSPPKFKCLPEARAGFGADRVDAALTDALAGQQVLPAGGGGRWWSKGAQQAALNSCADALCKFQDEDAAPMRFGPTCMRTLMFV